MHTSLLDRLRWARLALPILLLAAAACGDPAGPRPTPPPPNAVATVEVTPDTVRLPVGGTRGLHAIPRAADGRELQGRERAWRSGDESVVRVDVSGNVTALREGTATVYAVIEGKEGRARVTVSAPPGPPPVASVQVSPGTAEMQPGETLSLDATLRAADGSVLHGRPVTWASSDTLVATVRADGTVVALRGGTATVTASSEGRSGQAVVTVPAWLGFGLRSVAGAPLPAVVWSTRTSETRGEVTLVTERRVRVTAAQIWLSTTDGRYRQRFTLQSSEQVTQWFQGNSITGPERVTGQREIADEGAANGFYDVFTGDPFYASSVFAGHVFTAQRTAEGGRLIRQPVPGEGGPVLELRYAR